MKGRKNPTKLTCYVEDKWERGIDRVEVEVLYEDGIGVYVNSWTRGEADDDLGDLDEFIHAKGEVYYESLEDYRQGEGKLFKTFFKKATDKVLGRAA